MKQSKTPITLILFDAFDTLIVPRKPPPVQYAEEVRNVGVPISDQEMGRAFKESFKMMAKKYPIYGLRTGLSSPNEWWILLIKESLIKAGIPKNKIDAIMPELGPCLLDRFSSDKGYTLAEGVPGIFEQLHQLQKDNSSLRWNLATNSDARILMALKALGLERYFDLTIKGQKGLKSYDSPQETSSDSINEPSLSYFLGSEKPDEDFFRKAVQRSFPKDTTASLSNLCAQTLYVGDGLEEDYKGARKAGLQAVWLQRQQPWPINMSEVETSQLLAVKSMADIKSIIQDSWSE